METVILGCGEAFDETLPNTSLLVACDGTTIVLDCGFSVPPELWRAVPDAEALDAIYVTHGHADHFFGIPPVLTRCWEEGRRKPLSIVSQPAVLDQVRQALALAYPGIPERFQFTVEYRAAKAGETVAVGNASLRFAPTRHSAANLAVRVECGGHAVCYSGDGMFTDESRELFAGAGLLFHEAYSFEESPVHAEIGRVIEMAAQEGVERVGLVHVSRGLRHNPDRLVDAVQQGGRRVVLPEPRSSYKF